MIAIKTHEHREICILKVKYCLTRNDFSVFKVIKLEI